MIYLDCNASAPISDQVMEAVVHAMRTTGNPSSVHADGRAARALVEDARGAVAQMVDATAQAEYKLAKWKPWCTESHP